jgi:Protein of unknown function (DUF4232)
MRSLRGDVLARRFILASVVALVTPLTPLAIRGSASAAATIPICSHLVVATTPQEGAGGTGASSILFANSGKRCEIKGYPHVALFSEAGSKLKSYNWHQKSYIFAEPKPEVVVLSHNEVASVGLSWSDNPVDNEGCPRAAWLDVSLPNGTDVGGPDFRGAPCGGGLFVTPFELGPYPRNP